MPVKLEIDFEVYCDCDVTPATIIEFYLQQAQDLIKYEYDDVYDLSVTWRGDTLYTMTLWYSKEKTPLDVNVMVDAFVDPDDDGNDPLMDQYGNESLVIGCVLDVR